MSRGQASRGEGKSRRVKGRQPRAAKAAGIVFAALCVSAVLCCAASGAEAFITDQTGDEVSVLDLGTKHVVARIPVSGKPAGIAMARDGRTAYVTSPEAKYVSVIDTASRKIVAKIAIPDTPLGIAADPAGGFIYVAGFYQPRLYKVDLATGAIAASVEVGASPSGVSAANVESNDVSVVDLKEAKLLGTVAVGKRPYAVALARGRGFSTDQYGGTVSVFDLSTLQPVKRISVGDYPEGIETSADGNTIYVVNWFSNEVWTINTETLVVTAKMPVGDGPRAFGTFLREAL